MSLQQQLTDGQLTSDISSSNSPCDQLSEELLLQILQRVRQGQLAGRCTLVSRAWAAAAKEATTRVTLGPHLKETQLQEGLAWVRQHAGQLQSVAVLHRPQAFSRYLPTAHFNWVQLSKLTHLVLSGVQVGNFIPPAPATDSGSSSDEDDLSSDEDDHTIPLQDCRLPSEPHPLLPHLQELVLVSCTLPTTDCLQTLAASTQITNLQLQDVAFALDARPRVRDAELCKMLARMPQLVVLRLTNKVSFAVFEHIGAMPRLQELVVKVSTAVRDMGQTCASELPKLPASLTRLQLSASGEDLPAEWPRLQHLKSLMVLQLQDCPLLSPTVLASVPHVQHLQLDHCVFVQDDSNEDEDMRTEQSALALVRVLQQLTQLRSLELMSAGLSVLAYMREQRSAIAALTASSHLTKLVVETGVEEYEQPLPRGCLRYLFPADRQLAQLKVLQLAAEPYNDDVDDDVDEADVGAQALSPWCIAPGELSRIISCCPQLQDLSLTNVLHASTDVSPLLQLADSCRTLAVGGKVFGDAAVAVVTQLRRLRDLTWSNADKLTDAGLLQLTALSGLDVLRVSWCRGMSKQLSKVVSDDWRLERSVRKGPVYKQLRDICMCSPMLLRVHMQQEEAAREALQSENARLQQLVGQLQSQLSVRDAQVQRLRQALAQR